MKPPFFLSPLQRAWLGEIGIDLHWLARPATSAARGVLPSVPLAPSRVVADRRRPQGDAPAAAVPGGGQRDHPVYCVVGGQPGLEDTASGTPFQGDQGRLLRAILAAARLPQADSLYLTTVVKHRAAGGREPDAGEIAAALPALQRELAEVRPRWILALGRVAARALLGDDTDFEALRGTAQMWHGPQGESVPVWVTHHPSSLLVRSADKPAAWRDLVLLAQRVRAESG